MQRFTRLLRKLKIFFLRENFSRDLEEEMAFHREQAEKELQDDGAAPQDAMYAARRQFGNPTRLKEQSLDIVGLRFESVLQDLRFTFRQFAKNPGFAITAILVLALGIGAAVAIFAYVDAALIKPLPYENPSRLVAVNESAALISRANISYLDFLDWRKLNKVFSSLDAFTNDGLLLNTASGVQPVRVGRVSSGLFGTLGIDPIWGRDFTPGDETPNQHVVILPHWTWQQRYGGRKDVIGESLTLDGVSYTIIGILPRTFHFAPVGDPQFFVPLQPPNMDGDCMNRRGCHNLDAVARLKDDVSVQTALANMKSIAAQLEQQYPDSNRGQGASVIPLTEAIVGDIRPILLVLLAGAGLLLVIACVNVASLLLVRSEARRREIAVRGALGASPARLFRQFVTEGVVLVAAASACGIAAAYWTVQLLLRLLPANILVLMPYLQALTLSTRVLPFAIAISLLAAVTFSITPAIRLSSSHVPEDLATGGRSASGTGWQRLGSKLVVVELAIATVLLAGAGLLAKSFYRLLHVELGFQPDHLATLDIGASDAAYGKNEQAVALGRTVVGRVASLPGVESVALSRRLPVGQNTFTIWFRVPGRPYKGEHNEANLRIVSAEYFTTLKARLLRGRYFTDAEDASKPNVVLINQTLAKKYFPGEDAIGKKIGDIDLSPKSMMEIIGIVDDIREGGLDAEIWPAVYEPFNQHPNTFFSVVIRTSQSEDSVLLALAATIHQLDPNIGTRSPATMVERISNTQSAWLHRSSAWLVGGFASLALLLGVVGLYGVIAYSVSQRTREIGVRMALGAHRRLVYGLILKEAGWLVAIGILAGLVCAMATTTLMGKLLFGVRSWDLSTLAGVAAVLAISALLASYVPARRAASVNPVDALRAE